jgi:hypothetical protein
VYEWCAAEVGEYVAELLAILKAGWVSNVKEYLRSSCPALTEDHIYIPLHNSARLVAEWHKILTLRYPSSPQLGSDPSITIDFLQEADSSIENYHVLYSGYLGLVNLI